MKKILSLLLAVMLLAALLTACGGSETPEATPTPSEASDNETPDAPEASETPDTSDTQNGGVTVTDMTGRVITMDKPATRIVAVTAADCEILFALGAGDYIVGRGAYCDYPEAVFEIPVVESGASTNVEQIMALEPEVVIMASMAQAVEQVNALEAAGIRVVVIEAFDIAGTYTAIDIIGTLTGKTVEAETMISSMKNAFAEIEASVAGGSGETVYFEISPLEFGLWTAGNSTFMHELAAMLGLTNIFADVEGWGEISQEQVIERNPDYIFTISMYWGEGPLPEDEIMSREGWGGISAVANGNVFNADNNQIARPGPRLVDGAQSLYSFVYGG